MNKSYQGRSSKSINKFELVGGREVALRLPLPLAEVSEELQAEVERLAGEAGRKILARFWRRKCGRR